MKYFNLLILCFLLFTSCGIDPCYCLKGYEGKFISDRGGYHNSFTSNEARKCIDQYGDDIPKSYRGTNRFSNEMKRRLRKECK